jgi:hypothetical protein
VMAKPCRTIDDERPIKGVYFDDCREGVTVGHAGTTAIVPYYENGEMAPVVWFAVYKGKHLHARLNAAQMCEVVYAEAK